MTHVHTQDETNKTEERKRERRYKEKESEYVRKEGNEKF